MSDDKDDADGSDWLSSQFDPTREVPKQPAQAVPPVPLVPPAEKPPGIPPAIAVPAVPQPPVAPPPAPSDGGGFSWGLRPGAAAEPPPAVPVVPTPVVPAPVVPAPVVPTPAPAPPPTVPPATQAMEPPPTQAMEQPPTRLLPKAASRDDLVGAGQPTAAYTVQPWEPEASSTDPLATRPISTTELPRTELFATPVFGAATLPPADPDAAAGRPTGPAGPTSALDSLFADNKFEQYEDLGVLQTMASQPASPVGQPAAFIPPAPAEHAPITTTQRMLMIVAAGLIAVIALVALFFLGQRLGATSAVEAIPPASSGAATPAPAAVQANGLAAPGVQPFTALQGGECVQPFTTAWAATYTVVNCSAGHTGQLVFKGTLPDAATAAYPTGAQFQTEITPLCSASTAINYSTAKAVTDLQVSFSYPASAKAWDAGDRTYYCFVNRSGGGALPGNLAVAK